MNDVPTSQVRLSIIGLVCVSLFASLFVRLWYLQMVDDNAFKVAAEGGVYLRTIQEQGPRGRILDRKGRVLVDNRVSRVLGMDHRAMRDLDGCDPTAELDRRAAATRKELFGRLAVLLKRFDTRLKAPDIERLFCDPRWGPYDFVPLVTDVDEELELLLAERHDEFPGITVKRRSVRIYPYGSTAAHMLGYVGRINDSELEARQDELGTPEEPAFDGAKTYSTEDEIGKNGVELLMEDQLRGTPGTTQIQVDARGDYIRTTRQPELKPGNDVWLTIDVDLQAFAEQQLAAWIAARNGSTVCDRQNRCNAKDGAVVVLDPQNGELLAMASYPTYDPAELVNGISTDVWKSLTEKSRGEPMLNRAISGTFAPGSTFKIVTAHAALESDFLNRDEFYNDQGVYKLPGCSSGKCEFANAGRQKHYATNLVKALTVSSDTYFYRIADQMWRARDRFGDQPIQNSAFAFGFGRKTGIGLPGDGAGRIGTPEWLAAAYAETEAQGRHVFERGNWTVGDTINVSIGQGMVAVTPLQLANAYATFANGGTRYVPHVVSVVTRPKDLSQPALDLNNVDVVERTEPEAAGRVVFSDTGDYLAMYKGLQGVTEKGDGTADKAVAANRPAFPIAGKTGTAQVTGKADTSIFVTFGPAIPDQPAKYTIAAIIPQAGFGADAAAPLALQIMKALSESTVPPAVPSEPLSVAEGGSG